MKTFDVVLIHRTYLRLRVKADVPIHAKRLAIEAARKMDIVQRSKALQQLGSDVHLSVSRIADVECIDAIEVEDLTQEIRT